MATKKKNTPEMTRYQFITALIRTDAPPAMIQNEVRKLVDSRLEHDSHAGPAGTSIDGVMTLWSLATAFTKLAAENETLKRRLRRDNRKTAKPKAELLKKNGGQLQADNKQSDKTSTAGSIFNT